VQPALQDPGDPLAHRGGVAVPRQVDQAGQVAAVGVPAHEQPELAALAGVQHRLRDRDQLVDRRLEQLVARVGLEHVHQRLAGVALRVEPGPVDHRLRLHPDHRDAGQRLRVGGRGEQPEEPALADHLAVLVEGLDAHVVEVHRPVHGRLRVRLGQHQQGLLAGLVAHQRWQLAERRGHVLVRAQDAVAGARHRAQVHLVRGGPFAGRVLEVVLPVAQEREVRVREPLQQRLPLGDLLRRQRGRVLLQLVDDLQGPGVHLGPVLDRLADVLQHLAQGMLDLLALGRAGLPADLDVHPRLT
jgi:hypothetical protein